MKKLILIILLQALLLSACQSHFGADAHLGSSVNAAIQGQTVNPQAAMTAPQEVRGMDGQSAKSSIDSYQNTFIRRLPGTGAQPTNQGGLTGTPSASGSAPSYMSSPLQ